MFDGNFDKLIEKLQSLRAEVPHGVTAMARASYREDDGATIEVYYLRDKNEAELAYDARMQDKQDKQDLHNYIKLRAKFEPEHINRQFKLIKGAKV